jgi:hypothetical protein
VGEIDPYIEKYAKYERAWEAYVDRINGHRFFGGGFPARFSKQDKQEFIRTLVLIDMSEGLKTVEGERE